MEITPKENKAKIALDEGAKQANTAVEKNILKVDDFDESAAPLSESMEDDIAEAEAVSENEIGKDEAAADIKNTDSEMSKADPEAAGAAKDEFLSLDDDAAPHETPPQKDVSIANEIGATPKETPSKTNSEKKVAEALEPADGKEVDRTERNPNKRIRTQKRKTSAKERSSSKKIVGLAIIAVIIAGIVIHHKSAIIATKKEAVRPVQATQKTTTPVQTEKKAVQLPEPARKEDIVRATLAAAAGLRDELLAKGDEIEELKFHYDDGIAKLEELVIQQILKEGITSYAQALKNKRIEFDLRLIQRRKAYIRQLEYPVDWINQGSEELLYLGRDARSDLQLIDIASGIDLDRHLRYLNAAMQKYRLSADRLAINLQNAKLEPLETIWSQISSRKEQKIQSAAVTEDNEISKNICSEHFERIAELSKISVDVAKCLSQMNGSGLFLNGVVEFSPEAAKYLFQWRGNWICLNGLKDLNPIVAEYLFQWEGSWISLNGLSDFPPKSARHLLKWKGKQLELMGLQSGKEKLDRKTLKYMVQWEKSGGKLFVSEEVRQQMQQFI